MLVPFFFGKSFKLFKRTPYQLHRILIKLSEFPHTKIYCKEYLIQQVDFQAKFYNHLKLFNVLRGKNTHKLYMHRIMVLKNHSTNDQFIFLKNSACSLRIFFSLRKSQPNYNYKKFTSVNNLNFSRQLFSVSSIAERFKV